MSEVIHTEMEVGGDPGDVFDRFVEDLTTALEQRNLSFAPGDSGGIAAGSQEYARVTTWRPGAQILLETTGGGGPGTIEFVFQPTETGTRITFEVRDWAAPVREYGEEVGWFAAEFAARVLSAIEPGRLGDWVTDRVARRPSGRQSRATYRDPLYHYPNFRVILAELSLASSDHLLEVGCGGGALLHEALESGCRAGAIDHSMEMVRLARDVNRDAVDDGRLNVVRASADALPFADGIFTCATMTGVLGFLRDPIRTLAEIHRTLRQGGRFVALGSDPELRGTLAAPEPMASRLQFYNDEQLEVLGRSAGFGDVRVIHRDLEQHARVVGIPEDVVPLFSGVTRFLLAIRT
jgi:SAM-dependent methyltransferase